MVSTRSAPALNARDNQRPGNVIKITRHNYHPISVFIKNKDRVIFFSGTMDFLEQHIEIDVIICFKKLYNIFDVKLLCIEN